MNMTYEEELSPLFTYESLRLKWEKQLSLN